MTVFKGYMRIMKKNTGLILLYLCIFFGVTMALQTAAGKETYTSYVPIAKAARKTNRHICEAPTEMPNLSIRKNVK